MSKFKLTMLDDTMLEQRIKTKAEQQGISELQLIKKYVEEGLNNENINSIQQDGLSEKELEVAEQEYNRINELVADGLFLNRGDFVREAIKEKLKTYDKVTHLREIPDIQMKQEVIEYVKKHPEVDAVDIADDLLLDAFEVNDILVELIKEGILGEV